MKSKDEGELERIESAEFLEPTRHARRRERDALLNKPVEVTDATLKEMITDHRLVVVDCWAPWCRPCQMVAPVIEELSKDYAGRILFGILNVDENPQTSEQYEIMSIPTLLIFKCGKLRDKIIGAMPGEMLEPKTTHYL